MTPATPERGRPGPAPTPEQREALTHAWVDMADAYGNYFTRQYGDVGAKTFLSWLRWLAEHRVTPAEIKGAHQRWARVTAMTGKHPPNLHEFTDSCKPTAEEAGLPVPEQAFQHALSRHFSGHPVVYETARRFGLHRIAAESERHIRKDFYMAYALVCQEARWGMVFSGPPVEKQADLKVQPYQALDPAKAAPILDGIRAQLAGQGGQEGHHQGHHQDDSPSPG